MEEKERKSKDPLKNRNRFSTTLDPKLYKAVDELSKETKLNKSVLTDEAFMLLLKQYGKEIDKD